MAKQRALPFIVGTALVALLAACAPAAAPPTPKAETPKAEAPKTDTAKPAAPAAAGGPIKIGVLQPLTGALAVEGQDHQAAVEAYLDSINRTVAGRRIEVVVADTEAKPDVGLTKARQLVENDKVHLLTGIHNTAVCYAIAPYVKQAEIPTLVSGNCGAQDITINPRFASPYFTRMTQVLSEITDTMADFAYQKGYRKAVTIGSDFAGGTQTISGFQSAFIKRGGTIIQELFPALGTADFGPFLAQVDQSADVIVVFLPGADGLRFGEQFALYGAQKKLPVLDMFGAVVLPRNLTQLKDRAVGIVANAVYSSSRDDPENKTFIERWSKKVPEVLPSYSAANGYAGMQIIVAAIEKVQGNVENKQALLNAIYETNMQTAKGPIKLDQNHDVIQNIYVYEIVQQDGKPVEKLLRTYEGVSITWDRTLEEVQNFPWGETKGKLLNVTKEQLPQVLQQIPKKS